MSGKYPQISWIENDLDHQAQHLCFLAKTISLGDFARENYWVLPYVVKGEQQIVYFPDFSLSGQFWHAVSDCPNRDLGKTYPAKALTELKSKLAGYDSSHLIHKSQDMQTKWNMISGRFFDYCEQFLNLQDQLENSSRIEMRVSDFGTAGSYDLAKNADKETLIIIIRSDFDLDNLVRLLLMALWTHDTKKKTEIGERYWQDKMAVIDFLMTKTVFAQLTSSFTTVKQSYSIEQILKDSATYLDKLGFSTKPIITIQSNNIIIAGKAQIGIFTDQEERLLRQFITHNRKLIDLDQIGECLWGQDYFDKFSPYAITKVIENIRRKILNLGIHRELILTVRKKGYLFRN